MSNFSYNVQNVTEVQNETIFSSDSKYFDDDHSLATPPQLISTTLNKNPFPKKCISKRLPIKPLCGQNTGNLANIALSNSSSLSNSQTVRRSSRIFAQSANAVKENKKLPSSSSLPKHSCLSANLSINKDDHKNSKKLKVKKKIEIESLDGSLPTSSNSQDNNSNSQSKPSGDINNSGVLKNISENSRNSLNYDEINKITKSLDTIDENQKNKIGKFNMPNHGYD